MIASIALGLLFTALIASALGVVRSRHLVHSVFFLAATLLLTSVVYVLLGAPFLAGIQVVLYTGGVITLMLFGVMLTRHRPDTDVPNPAWREGPAGLLSVVLFGVFAAAIWAGDLPRRGTPAPTDAADIGRLFLTDHLIAFEALSVLLLAAMVGAIVLARKEDP